MTRKNADPAPNKTKAELVRELSDSRAETMRALEKADRLEAKLRESQSRIAELKLENAKLERMRKSSVVD